MMISKLRGVYRNQLCDPPRGLEIIWEMYNTVISKLRSVCRTQSCDPPRILEITWGLTMNKLLNLITYPLAYLLTCTNWVLSCICECLAKHESQISVALFEMMLMSLYMFLLVRYESLCLWWSWLTCLFTSCHILGHSYLLVISCGLLWGFTLVLQVLA
jgi:hypothetical protein